MVSKLMVERLGKGVGKFAKIFLRNKFVYEGKITGCDEKYVEIINSRNGKFKIILIDDIQDCEVDA